MRPKFYNPFPLLSLSIQNKTFTPSIPLVNATENIFSLSIWVRRKTDRKKGNRWFDQKVLSGLNDQGDIDLAINSSHIGYQDVAGTVSDRKIVGMVKFTQSWSSIIGIPFFDSRKKCGV